MEKKKIFIDGREGTTGLRIFERLAGRDDVEMLVLPEETRKDPAARKAMLHQAYVAFLCLPDDAAKESAALAEGSDVILIDTSTAHRTNPAWAYGFPELSPESEAKIRSSKRIAVPGCHASGFVSLVQPCKLKICAFIVYFPKVGLYVLDVALVEYKNLQMHPWHFPIAWQYVADLCIPP